MFGMLSKEYMQLKDSFYKSQCKQMSFQLVSDNWWNISKSDTRMNWETN